MFYGIAKWNMLPEQMPIHFDMNGNPNNWGGRWINVFLMPAIMFVMNATLHISFNLKAKKMGAQGRTKFFMIFKWFVPVVAITISFLTYSYSLGLNVNIPRIIMLILSILFLLIGNYFPKAEKWMFNIEVKEGKLTSLKRTLGWSFAITGVAGLFLALANIALWAFLALIAVLSVIIILSSLRAAK